MRNGEIVSDMTIWMINGGIYAQAKVTTVWKCEWTKEELEETIDLTRGKIPMVAVKHKSLTAATISYTTTVKKFLEGGWSKEEVLAEGRLTEGVEVISPRRDARLTHLAQIVAIHNQWIQHYS